MCFVVLGSWGGGGGGGGRGSGVHSVEDQA